MKDPASDLTRLDPYDEKGILRMVVETPRGASIKLAYEPGLGTFVAKRSLALGITYPFDWGFIPGTLAADGDPLDALAVHDGGTYPGVILPCRPLGVVDVTQKGKHGREDNPRLVASRHGMTGWESLRSANGLPQRLKAEIEQFFLSATFFTGKDARIEGWRGPRAASKLIERTRRG
jgi:inorganic pyrophosphatase